MTRVDPLPSVQLGTETIATAGTVRVLDGLSATWGRSRWTEHHDSQVGTFRVRIEPGRDDWSTRDWGATPVTMKWTHGATERVFFRGAVSEVSMVPLAPHPRTGASRGAVLEFSAPGVLTELGNRRTGTATWPDESGAQRLARIAALAAPAVASITMRDYWAGAPFAARKVDRTDLLSLLRALYDTSGFDRMTYDPHTNSIGYVRRRAVPPMAAGSRKRAKLYTDASFGQGVAPRVLQPGVAFPMLDGRELTGTGELTKTIEGRITRADYSWAEAGTGAAASGLIYDPVAEADRGVTALNLSTELRQGDWALICARDWLDGLWREGSKHQPAPMVYRADLFGGFPSMAHAQLLIGGAELGGVEQGAGSLCWIGSTPWAALGIAPIFGVIGGTIRYSAADGGWSPTFHAQAGWHDDLTEDRPIRCGELLADSTRTPFTWAQLGRGVTWADLRHVSTQ